MITVSEPACLAILNKLFYNKKKNWNNLESMIYFLIHRYLKLINGGVP